MLVRRLQRWPSIKITSVPRFVLAVSHLLCLLPELYVFFVLRLIVYLSQD